MSPRRPTGFASLWWQLSLPALLIAALAIAILVWASMAMLDARAGFRSTAEVDLPRLETAASLSETAMTFVALRDSIAQNEPLDATELDVFRENLSMIAAVPRLSEQVDLLNTELQALRRLAKDRARAQHALNTALTEIRWLNIDLDSELQPLRDDLYFDLQSQIDIKNADELQGILRQSALLQEIDTQAGALVTLLFQAATTQDIFEFVALGPLLQDTELKLSQRRADLPDRWDFVTLRQTLELLEQQAVGQEGLIAHRTAFLGLQSEMVDRIAEVQDLTEVLHNDFLAIAKTEREAVLDVTLSRAEALSARLWIFAVLGVGVTILLCVLLLRHYRKNVVQPLVQLSTALRDISSGQMETNIPLMLKNEIGEIAMAVRGFRSSVQGREEANQLLASEVEGHKETLRQLREAQTDLIQAAKMATLGEMSAGLSHELNQPLISLQHRLHSLQAMLDSGETEGLAPRIEKLRHLTHRMSATVKHFKRFSRRSDPGERVPVDLSQAVSGAESLISHRFENSDVTFSVQKDLADFHVKGDQGMIEQILLNLYSNALDSIETLDKDTTGEIHVSAVRSKGFVDLTIADNGIGLMDLSPEDAMAPFVTRKPPGQGLGLGLSLSRKVALEMGGRLFVRSRQSGGAKAILSLEGV